MQCESHTTRMQGNILIAGKCSRPGRQCSDGRVWCWQHDPTRLSRDAARLAAWPQVKAAMKDAAIALDYIGSVPKTAFERNYARKVAMKALAALAVMEAADADE